MLRIGIVGSESSHAMQFAKYFNLPDPVTGAVRYEDIRVTAIMGDPDSAAKTAAQAQIPQIAESLQELSEIVDAVMITSRRGSDHTAQAMPFIDKKIPILIDKPFTSDLAMAHELDLILQQHNCPVLGGSGCKYCESILKIKSEVARLTAENKLLTAMLHFPIMLDSPYDGFWFYGSHLVEMCMEIFGTDILSVQAMETDAAVVANVLYPGFVVSLHFVTEVWEYTCVLVTEESTKVFPISIDDSLSREADRFARLLHRDDLGMTVEELVRPVRVIDAILRAVATGRTINFTKEVLQ